jgi:hypothetical protein
MKSNKQSTLDLYKVQLPLNRTSELALVYNKDKSVWFRIPIDVELLMIAKRFFHRGWIDTEKKFFAMGYIDNKHTFQIFPTKTTKKDQQVDW